MPKQSNKNEIRRKLLKTAILTGVGAGTLKAVPDNWSKPLVSSVILPAHAETSPVAPAFTATCLITSNEGQTTHQSGSTIEEKMDLMVTFTITPMPASSNIVQIKETAGDGVSFTDAPNGGVAGNVATQYIAVGLPEYSVGDTETLTLIIDGADIGSCSWVVGLDII